LTGLARRLRTLEDIALTSKVVTRVDMEWSWVMVVSRGKEVFLGVLMASSG